MKTQKYKRLMIFFILSLIIWENNSLSAQTGNTIPIRTKEKKEQIVSRLQKLIPRLLEEALIPGISIALVQKGKVVWHKGFGVRDAQQKDPVLDNTMFEAASLSKPVFAYAVLKLVDAGKLDLDTPLNKYLPGNYDVGEDSRIGLITARHILSHTSGFPNWRRGNLKIFFTPGERFSYSGEGFVYLQKVVEHITGLQLNDFMKKFVFDQLGMVNSSYLWRDEFVTRVAPKHDANGISTGQERSTQQNAAASLKTTAQDYGRFLTAVMNKKGLRKETWKMMLTPQIKLSESGTNNTAKVPEKLSPYLSWGLGWGLQNTSDGQSFWHWGDNGNTKAYVIAFEKEQIGLVIFANSVNGLSILKDIIYETLGGNHPALNWLEIENYDSPGKKLMKSILAKGAVVALSDLRQVRKNITSADILNESKLNLLGYSLISSKRVKDAIEVFKFIVEDYPQSFNAWDSLAEAYLTDGNNELAIKYYEKSVELNPNSKSGIDALKKLKEVK